MYLKVTYDQEFDDLIMHLRSKYPKTIFNIDGIGDQLDMSKFSKNFFKTQNTADASIDGNANVSDSTVISYHHELPKPFFKINSYYMLWKGLKKYYGIQVANDIIERQISGDIYIHDVHGIGGRLPYSYHPHTILHVKIDEEIMYLTMEDLFNIFVSGINDNSDYEEIIFDQYFEVKINNISRQKKTDHLKKSVVSKKYKVEIFDENNKWTEVKRVLRHKTNKKLLKINTHSGLSTIVTEDHPVILENGSEKNAEMLTNNDYLKVSKNNFELKETIKIDNDFAYLLGFWIGDGHSHISKGKNCDYGCLHMTQKNIVKTKCFKTMIKYFDNVNRHDDMRASFGGNQLYNYVINELKMGTNASCKKMPTNVCNWNKQAIYNLICGIIDSDGDVNPKNGRITVRTASFAMIQQIQELLKFLGIADVRSSFVKKQKPREESFKSTKEMFRVSFRLDKKNIDNFIYSNKIEHHYDLCCRKIKEDGRWDSNKIYSIEEYNNEVKYVYDITTKTGTFHSQGLIQHNCFNYSTYDIAIKGLPMIKKIKSIAPKYLYSFKSQVEQFTIIAANSTLGATGLADFLIVFSWYVDKIFKYNSDAGITFDTKYDCRAYIKETLTSFIYTINQPNRGNQSCFTNLSIYDDCFLINMLDDYIFPDGTTPNIVTVKNIQELYLKIMNEEMARTPITFPVTTACMSIDDENNIQDEDFVKLVAKYNKKYGFINIFNGKTSVLSSCCRLRSDKNNEYFNSFGAGSSKIGSLGVVTLNLPRIAYKQRNGEIDFEDELNVLVEYASKINHVKRKLIQESIDSGYHPLYSLGFIDLSRQYSTVGITGFSECIEIMGKNIVDHDGVDLGLEIIDIINKKNIEFAKQYHTPHNCEQVPAESASIKIAMKDKIMKYNDDYEMYSNQFIPLTTSADMLDRIKIQGLFDKHFTGGAICHINVETEISDESKIADLIKLCAKKGVVYWAINYTLQECENGHMTVGKGDTCSICGKKIINEYCRVVGFLTNVKNWNKTRREIDYPERQWYNENSSNKL